MLHTLSLRTFVALDALKERVPSTDFYEGYRIISIHPNRNIYDPIFRVTLDMDEGAASVHLPASTMITVRHDAPVKEQGS